MNDESLDLRIPIRFVLHHWMWIVLIATLSGLIALAITMAMPRTYEAEATLMILQSRTEVQFDPRIVTLADYELSRSTAESRRQALVALVKSNEVVSAVLTDVAEHLQPDERSIAWLRDVADVETAGDLINLEVRYPDPEVATTIANRWMQQYEQHVNQIYGTYASGSRIEEQVTRALERYNTAQAALEEFEATDPTEALQRELDARTAIVDGFQEARIASQTLSVDRNTEILNAYYRELAQIKSWMSDAQALRSQVAADTGSNAGNMGNAMALILLRSRVFGGNDTRVLEEGTVLAQDAGPIIQVELTGLSEETVRPEDIDPLIASLENRQRAVQERIDDYLQGLQEGDDLTQLIQLDERINRLTSEITFLQSQLEAASAQSRELTDTRDIAWETYQVLKGRQVEEQIASQFTSSEVRIADRAIVPEQPLSRGVIRNTVLAALFAAALTVGIFLAYAFWAIDEIAPQLELQPNIAPTSSVNQVPPDEGSSGVTRQAFEN